MELSRLCQNLINPILIIILCTQFSIFGNFDQLSEHKEMQSIRMGRKVNSKTNIDHDDDDALIKYSISNHFFSRGSFALNSFET